MKHHVLTYECNENIEYSVSHINLTSYIQHANFTTNFDDTGYVQCWDAPT